MVSSECITIVSPGIYHNFDVANEIYSKNLLRKIHTFVDPLRVIKYRKSIPYNMIEIHGSLLRKIVREKQYMKLNKITLENVFSNNDIVLTMPSVSLEVYRRLIHSKKILDVDHINIPNNNHVENMPNIFKKYGSHDPLKFKKINQHYILMNEYKKRGMDYEYPVKNVGRELAEIQLADKIIVPVSYIYNGFVDIGVPTSKLHLLPYGYDHKLFYSAQKTIFANRRCGILYAGTISIRKGWFYLKDIIKMLIKENNYDISIAGSPTQEVQSDFKAFLKNNGCVKYYGRVSQKKLGEIMRDKDILIFPSVLEGYGLTILQAMACGMQVVTSRLTCGVDLIKNEMTGRIVENNNSEAWLEAINQLVKYRKRSLHDVLKELKKLPRNCGGATM